MLQASAKLSNPIFFNNNTLTVNALGPGTLYLLSFPANATNDPPFAVGHIDSTHNYNCFTFYWDGTGHTNHTVSKPLA
jgi:hypothetical protein